MTLIAVKSLAAFALLAAFPSSLATDPGVFPPSSSPYGASYAEWAAEWTKWTMEFPLNDPLGAHPGSDDPLFNVAYRQTGKVWFLATPVDFGTATPTPRTRNITIPKGTALFVGTINGEMSSLEGAMTEAEQRFVANFQADRIVDLTCTLDGRVVDHDDYRFETEQFSFTAPTPWVFGATGGPGTSVADGYYLMLRPLSVGQHVLHYTGGFHFEAGIFGPEPFDITADMTYVITVAP